MSRNRTASTEAELIAPLRKTARAYGGHDAWQRDREAGRTKLSYEHWAAARTPAFKSWAGNWEGKRARETLQHAPAVPVTMPEQWADLSIYKLRDVVEDAYAKAAKQGAVLTKDGRNVRLTPRGFDATTFARSDRNSIGLLACIRDVLAVAEPVTSRAHEKVNERDSVRAWHYYAVKVNMDRREMMARLVVREDVKGNIYFDNQLSGIEKASERTEGGSPARPEAASAHEAGTVSVAQEMDAVKNFVPSHFIDEVTKEPTAGIIEQFMQKHGWAVLRSPEAAEQAKADEAERQRQYEERAAQQRREEALRQGYIHNDFEQPYVPQRVPLSAAQKRLVRQAFNSAIQDSAQNPAGHFGTVEKSTNIRALAAGFRALAESEGWTADVNAADAALDVHGVNKYFTLRKGKVEIPVRISDHARTNMTRHYESVAINLVPSAEHQGGSYGFAYDTFESTLWKLRNASVNEDGELYFGGKPAVMFKLTAEERAAQGSFDFDAPAPEEPALEAAPRGEDHSAARVLNWALARKFDNPDWRNAYTAAPLPEGMAALQADFEAAFGRTIHPVMPTAERFNSFGGVYLPEQPGKVFVNVRRAHEVGFLQLAGHELLHDLKRDRPDLYHWFVAQADQYLTNVEDYRQRLNVLSEENGIAAHSLQSAKEELIADFTGDALADTQFLGQLAKSDSNRFTSLVQSVSAWFDKLGNKLRGRGMKSAQHVKDVDGLRKHLGEVLIAYVNGKEIEDLPSYQAQAKKREGAFEVMLHHDRRTNELIAHKKGDGLKRPLKRWTVPEGTAASKYALEVAFPWIRENRAELVAAWEGVKFSQQPEEQEALAKAMHVWRNTLQQLKPNTLGIAHAPMPIVLRTMGEKAPKLKLKAGYLQAILHKHPDVPHSVYKNLPALIHDPLFVFAHRDGGLDVVIDATTDKGEPIIVGVRDGEVRTVTPYNDVPERTGKQRLATNIDGAVLRGEKLYARTKLELEELRAQASRNDEAPVKTGASATGAYRDNSVEPLSDRRAMLVTRQTLVNKHGEPFYKLAAPADDIKLSLTAVPQQQPPKGVIRMDTDNDEERTQFAHELLPERSEEAIEAQIAAQQSFAQMWPINTVERIEDDKRAALVWAIRDRVSRPPQNNPSAWPSWIYHSRNRARQALTVVNPEQVLRSMHDGTRYGGYSTNTYAHASLLMHLPRATWSRITAVKQTYTGIEMELDGQALHLTTDVLHGRGFDVAAEQIRPLLNGQPVNAQNIEYRKPYHEIVSEQLAERLRARQAPWQQRGARLPMNPVTGQRYKGANTLHLMMQGRSDPRWLTWAQAREAGAQVRDGERGVTIQYWRYTNEQGEKLERPQSYYATVFNAEQIDGLPPLQEVSRTRSPSEHASAILTASRAKIAHTAGNHTGYGLKDDTIYTPDPAGFENSEHYYAAAMRGLTWWAGHPSRLNLDIAQPPGSQGHAECALRSEIAVMLLGDEIGIQQHDDPIQHNIHVEQWINLVQRDPLAIDRLAADAEQIRAHVLGLEQQQELTPEQEQQQAQAQQIETQQAETQQPQTQAAQQDESTAERIWLDVPPEDQDEARALGAVLDEQARAWYIPEDAPGQVAAELAERWPEREEPQILPGNVQEQAQTQASTQPPEQPPQAQPPFAVSGR